MEKKRIGLIGLGLMGSPMARVWLKKGFQVSVLPHKNVAAADGLVKDGAQKARSLKELVGQSDVIVTMVPTSREVEALAKELEGFMTPAQLFIDMSTSEPASSAQIGEKFQALGLRFFDAPVTGGVKGAAEGSLTLFLGGPKEWIDEARDVLEAVSVKCAHFGKTGQGHVAKVINNFICIGNIAVLAEALPLAAKLGLDSRKIFETLSGGMAASRQLDFYGPQILRGDFAPRFRLSHAVKDMKLVEEIGENLKVKLPLLEGILENFKDAVASGFSGDNVSALIRPLEEKLAARFRGPS